MELENYAHALGVRVVVRAPSGNSWGEYCHTTRTIRISPHLGPVQHRSVLAHEVGHAFHEHHTCHPRNEREADIWAATWLINRHHWSEATALYDTVEAVAHELGVLPKLVRVYHEHQQRFRARRNAA